MRNLALFILLALVCLNTSCVSIRSQTAVIKSPGEYVVKIQNDFNLNLKTVTIDSCEYLIGIIGFDQRSLVMSHKGNCQYCAGRKMGK